MEKRNLNVSIDSELLAQLKYLGASTGIKQPELVDLALRDLVTLNNKEIYAKMMDKGE